jgi:hypothetical protein
VPAATFAQAVIADVARSAGAIAIPIAVLIGMATTIFHAPFAGVGSLLSVFGIVAWLFGVKRTREILKWELEREITVAHLIDNPKLRIWAQDPPWSKALEDKLRADLTVLKGKIMASVDLGKKESFEL